jgi:hypothetical protein
MIWAPVCAIWAPVCAIGAQLYPRVLS